MVENPEPKTLIILEGKDWFEFFFEGDNKYWRVRDHLDYPGWFIIEEYEDGWYRDESSDKYEHAGVSDLQGLYEALIRDPVRTLEGLLGEKFLIKEVKVEKVEE